MISGTNMARWYTTIIREAELVDYAPIRGCTVIRPYGYAIWELFKESLNNHLRRTGHQAAYFPLLIPERFVQEEAEYVDKLVLPRVLTVTQAGGQILQDPLVIRPTSETIVSYMFARWIRSYRDLPLKIYQWSNVARWESRTHPLLKAVEILWLEGHTAHATHREAIDEVDLIASLFVETLQECLAIPVIMGPEPEGRKFAGSVSTYSVETLMPNGKSLQVAAVYDLGQKFTRAFDVLYTDSENNLRCCWTTNWGLSVRVIGATVLIHGDDIGLRLPPKIAPIQVIILPVYTDDIEKTQYIANVCYRTRQELESVGIRAHIDERVAASLGKRIRQWEVKGVPIRIEIGVRELESELASVARRDTSNSKVRLSLSFESLPYRVNELLADIQNSLFDQALASQTQRTTNVSTYQSLKKVLETSWATAEWCGLSKCEQGIKEDMGAVIRCFILDKRREFNMGRCFRCGSRSAGMALFGRGF